mmetsp:Transcript_54837/g.141279  ORF Transcript_54837/g.141279 Transcript_54837/m.141279 type:complete len:329 (+) Transcript_54837:4131-5117(+)
MNLRASVSAVLAATSPFSVSSDAARRSAALISMSLESSASTSALLATCFTRSSAFFTSNSASRMVASFFRVAVFFFSSCSFLEWPSKVACSSLSFAVASWAGPGAKRFTSTSLVAMNILAMETAVLAAVADISQALTAARVSAMGSSSTPIRKGPSASAAFVADSATAVIFSVASCKSMSHTTFCETSCCFDLRSVSLFCDSLQRSSSFAISSLAIPAAVRFFCSINRVTLTNSSLALALAASACIMPSLVASSSWSSIVVISSALSTSTSAGESFSVTSCTSFCAAARWTKSCRAFFRGFSLVCASCSCACSLPSSVAACSRAFALS